MITLTTDQKRRLTSFADVKVAVEIGTKLRLITSPSEDADYGYYNCSCELDYIEENIDDLGGFGESAECQVRINNVHGLSDLIAIEGTPVYLENTETTIKLIIDDTDVYTLMKSVVESQELDQYEWTINLLDESEKFNINILEEVTLDNYPDAPEESIGSYLTVHYGDFPTNGIGTYNFCPAINVQKGKPKIVLANHNSDWDSTIFVENLAIYLSEVDFYSIAYSALLVSDSVTKTGGITFVTFDDCQMSLYNYKKYQSSERCNSITVSDIKNLIGSGTMALVNPDRVSIKFQLGNFGKITYNSFHLGFNNGSLAGTPVVRLYNSETSAAVNETTITGTTSYTFTPDLLSFDEMNYHYLEVECGVGDTITLSSIWAEIQYQPFNTLEKIKVSDNKRREWGKRL